MKKFHSNTSVPPWLERREPPPPLPPNNLFYGKGICQLRSGVSRHPTPRPRTREHAVCSTAQYFYRRSPRLVGRRAPRRVPARGQVYLARTDRILAALLDFRGEGCSRATAASPISRRRMQQAEEFVAMDEAHLEELMVTNLRGLATRSSLLVFFRGAKRVILRNTNSRTGLRVILDRRPLAPT